MIYRVEDGDFKDMATQHMLAPIFSGLKAEKALSKGDLFIINDTLYKATADIAQDAQIVVGTNAELASTMAEELSASETVIIKAINKTYSNVSFGASGEASAPAPSTPTGYTFLFAIPNTYSGTAYGAISYMGNYLQGPLNKSFSSIGVRFVYVKTEWLNTSTV